MQQPWPPSDAGPGWTVGRVRSHSLISSEVRLLLLIGGAAVFGSFLVWNENFKRPRALSGSSAYKDDCRSKNPLVELWIFLSISFKNMMLYDFSTGICRKGALMSSAVVTLMRVRKADSCFNKTQPRVLEGLISPAKEHLSPIRLWGLTPGCCAQFHCIFDVRLIFC